MELSWGLCLHLWPELLLASWQVVLLALAAAGQRSPPWYDIPHSEPKICHCALLRGVRISSVFALLWCEWGVGLLLFRTEPYFLEPLLSLATRPMSKVTFRSVGAVRTRKGIHTCPVLNCTASQDYLTRTLYSALSTPPLTDNSTPGHPVPI